MNWSNIDYNTSFHILLFSCSSTQVLLPSFGKVGAYLKPQITPFQGN